MQRARFVFAFCVAIVLAAPVCAADVTNTFASDPLNDASLQGPDAGNAGTRFSYNSAEGTLTAHYDTSLPTVKLVFPLGQHFTQATSFTMSTQFKLLSGGTIPGDYGASAPAFGMLNSVTTGSLRNSTGYSDANWNWVEETPGTAYDLMTFDYFPTLDESYGGNSYTLTTVCSAREGWPFSDYLHPAHSSLISSFALGTVPVDEFVTATLAYDSATQRATLNWGGNSVSQDLTGSVFDLDSFGITLWEDTNLTPPPPAVGFGSAVKVDVVFDSFSVTATPEPGSLAFLACGALALLRFRAGRRYRG